MVATEFNSELFQYPRVDRLICGGLGCVNLAVGYVRFSILVWIDLFVGVLVLNGLNFVMLCFSILVWIDLFVG